MSRLLADSFLATNGQVKLGGQRIDCSPMIEPMRLARKFVLDDKAIVRLKG